MKKLSAFILTMVMLLLVIAPVTNASALDIESIENSKRQDTIATMIPCLCLLLFGASVRTFVGLR